MAKMTGKVTHVGIKADKDGNERIDSVLLNCSLGKTLTVPYNSKTFGAADGSMIVPKKGNIVDFQHDGIFEVDFEDTKTGEMKTGDYLEADNFKFLDQREPEIRIHRRKVDLSQPEQAADAPHPADDPASFSV